jgi:bifunctional UDP-N-acetylglucosamine pyrophosphorylase/glucosamine-1-phosphate N-acetyltransferase
MKTNNKLNKANSYRLSQELLRNKALAKGVNLIAPETIFLSQDTFFGKNVTIEPYVVFGPKVKVGDNSHIKSFTHIEGTKIEKNVICWSLRKIKTGYNFKKKYER